MLADATTKATVFAPTDNAFSNLLAAIGLTAAQLLADPSTLSQVRGCVSFARELAASINLIMSECRPEDMMV